jgi:hypothetical protein
MIFVACLTAALITCACQAPAGTPPAPADGEGPPYLPLYNTTCIFYEGAEVACPASYATRQVWLGQPIVTLCCPASLADSALPTATAEPPWAPNPCMHTGVQECDAYLAALHEYWKHGDAEERASVRYNLDLGCGAYRHAIAMNGIEQTRISCLVGLDLLPVYARRTRPAPPPMSDEQREARGRSAIDHALRHQITPRTCPHTLSECDAYVAAFYECWQRATPEVRSFLEPGLHVDCSVWSEMAAANDGAGLRENCQAALDAVIEHPACKGMQDGAR